MFGKRKKNEAVLNATNAYISEMIRAILQEEFKTQIYLTQIRFKTTGPKNPEPNRFWQRHRPYTNAVMEVEVSAFFTSLNIPLPKGHEGEIPLLPRVKAVVDLTNEMNGWYKWDILLAHVRVVDYNGPMHPLILKVFSQKDTAIKSMASFALQQLSEELRQRGPNVLHQNM